MGFGYIIAGLVFFFNPSVNIIDILPDFIGCFLIIKGLGKIGYLSPSLADAKKVFTNLLFIYLIKTGMNFLLIVIPEKEYVWKLIFVFTFAVFECIFLFRAFDNLLSGTSYLSTKCDNESFFNGYQNAKSMTTVFIAARIVLNIIPEFTYLYSEENSGLVTAWQSGTISAYHSMLTIVNLFFTFVLGAVWLSLIIPYFFRLKKDKHLNASLEKIFERDVASNEGLMLIRSTRTPLYLLAAGAVFFPSIAFTGVNVLPEFIGALMIFSSSIMLRKYSKKAGGVVVTSAIYTGVSGVYWTFALIYALEYFYANIVKVIDAYSMFTGVAVLSVFSAAAGAAMYYFVWKMLKEIIEKHTGADVSDIAMQRIDRTRKTLHKMNNQMFAFSIIASVSHSVMSGVVCDTKSTVFLKISQYSVIDFVISLIFAFLVIRVSTSIIERMEYKYI